MADRQPQQDASVANAASVLLPNAATANLSLYVGNLGPDIVEGVLYEKFGSIGAIASVRICRDSMTRRSLGYAYVNFINPDHAKTAIDEFNYELLNNRPMRVMYSERNPQLRRSGLGNIFISNLHKDIDTRALHDTFSKYGNILSCKISIDAATGKSRGYGFVHFASEKEAKDAIGQLNNMMLQGQQISVLEYKTKQTRKTELEQNFRNIFIKNLPETFTKEELDTLFGKFGVISRSTVRQKDTGECKGYGFVEFESHEAAKAAIEQTNNLEIVTGSGRRLEVMRAQRKAERQEVLRYTARVTKKSTGENLYVKNLDDTVNEDALRDLFSPFGTVKSVHIARDENKRSRGFGFVAFNTQEEATKAVTELNSKFFSSKPLYVARHQSKEERRQHLQLQFSMRANQTMQPYGMYPMMMPGGMGPMGGMAGMPMGNMGAMPQMQSYPGGYPNRRPPMMQSQQRNFPPQQPQFRPNNMTMPRPRPTAAAARPGYAAGPSAAAVAARAPRAAMRSNEPLVASVLASMSDAEQKQAIGERLFPLIQARHGERAGKITGMLLEMDNSELLHMLDDQQALLTKETEALKVLEEHARNGTH